MTVSGKRLYFRLLGYVRPYWRIFALAIAAMVVLAATEPAIPAILKPTLDGSFVDRDLRTVAFMAVLIVLVFLLRGVAAVMTAVALSSVASKVVLDLREQMYRKILALPVAYFDRHATGALVSKVTFDVTQITSAATHVLTIFVRDSLAILGLLGWMLYLDWQLTLVALIAAPVVVFIVRHFSHRLRRVSRSLQDAMGGLTHVLAESIDGHKVVRSFGAQAYERGRFRQVANQVRRFQVKFAAAAASNAPIAQFVTAIALAVILYISATRSAAGELSIGSFVSFLAAMAMLFSPLKRLTGVNGPLQQGLAAAESVFGLIDERAEADTGTLEPARVQGQIAFDNVSFSYPSGQNAPALEAVSFRVEAGETVAFVGPSGSGKSTLASLLCRFYHPCEGRILLDGVDVRELKLAALRRSISLVSQDIVLFQGSIAENIAYGSLASCARHDIEEAARNANALAFVNALEQGFETPVGPNGVRLSGGQRQRIAIARAFLKAAPILILDEATSSLDSASEYDIQLALEALGAKRTTIIIAHRLSTVEKADRIIVMNQGRVDEIGTHSSLLESNSLYAGLYRFQLSRPTESEPAAHAR